MALTPTLIFALLAAGCTQSPSSSTTAATGLSAVEASQAAIANATSWASDAVLVQVTGTEENRTRSYDCPLFSSGPDAALGDGRAPKWAFHFVSDAKASSVSVAMYENGSIIRCEVANRYSSLKGPALPSAWIDSTVAATKAKELESFRTFVPQHAARIDYTLRTQDDGKTVWQVNALGPDGGLPLMSHVTIDAKTGERIP